MHENLTMFGFQAKRFFKHQISAIKIYLKYCADTIAVPAEKN